jgi:hypothetical protein
VRALHLVFAGLFAVSAALQYNDPDPLGWALLYLAAAILAAGAWWRSGWTRLLAFGLIAVCAAWMATLLPGFGAFIARGDPGLLAATMQAGDPVIEEAREFLGLGIVLAYAVAAIALPALLRTAR